MVLLSLRTLRLGVLAIQRKHRDRLAEARRVRAARALAIAKRRAASRLVRAWQGWHDRRRAMQQLAQELAEGAWPSVLICTRTVFFFFFFVVVVVVVVVEFVVMLWRRPCCW